MSKSRWRINIDGKGVHESELQEGPDTIPVLDIYNGEKVISQIGLNIPHAKSKKAYFKKLKGDISSIYQIGSRYFFEPRIFRTVHGIMYRDPSISSFTFTRLNTFRIHLSDSALIKTLEGDERRHNINRVYYLLKSAEYKPNKKILEEISKNPRNYAVFLASIDPKKRKNFHQDLLEIAKQESEKNVEHSLILESASRIRDEVDRLRGLAKTYYLENAIRKLEEEARLKKTLDENKLSELYGAFMQNPFITTTEEIEIPCFSNVERMPTTLHERANKGYSNDIFSFRVTESFSNLDLGFGEERITLGFRDRMTLIEGELA